MVHSRLRRNRLNYIIENDTTYIVVPKHQVPFNDDNTSYKQKTVEQEEQKPAPVPVKRTTVATVIGLYQKENRYLKMKIEELEAKIDRLVNDKEQLLKDESKRIEKVYQDKDTQLKAILELVNTKLLHDANIAPVLNEQIENIDVIEQKSDKTAKKPVELKQYLRSLEIKATQRKQIKRRFAKAYGADSRVILNNGLFYLDFERYDYSDLLKLG